MEIVDGDYPSKCSDQQEVVAIRNRLTLPGMPVARGAVVIQIAVWLTRVIIVLRIWLSACVGRLEVMNKLAQVLTEEESPPMVQQSFSSSRTSGSAVGPPEWSSRLPEGDGFAAYEQFHDALEGTRLFASLRSDWELN